MKGCLRGGILLEELNSIPLPPTCFVAFLRISSLYGTCTVVQKHVPGMVSCSDTFSSESNGEKWTNPQVLTQKLTVSLVGYVG